MTDLFSCLAPVLPDLKAPSFPAPTLAVKPFKRQKRKSPVSDDGAFAWLSGAGDGNSTRSLTRLLRTSFPIQASRNGLDCGLKSSAWSTQAVAGDPKRAKHIHQQPEHRISFRSLSVYWHTTPQVATDRRAASSKDRLIIDRRGLVFHPLDEPLHGLRGFALAAQQVGREHRWGAGQGTNGDVRAL